MRIINGESLDDGVDEPDPLTECENCGAEIPISQTHGCGATLCPECVCEECENA
jgi:hypothetical protein